MVLTTSLQLFALDYSPSAPNLIVTTSSISLLEKYARLAEFQTILYDPIACVIIVLAYQGVVKVIPLKGRATSATKGRRGSKSSIKIQAQEEKIELDLAMGYNVRLPALNLTSLELLSSTQEEDGESAPILALIHGNHLGERVFVVYELDLADKELIEGPFSTNELVLQDQGSEKVLVTGANTEGREEGVVIIGEESLKWVALRREGEGPDKGKGKVGEAKKEVQCKMPIGLIQA